MGSGACVAEVESLRELHTCIHRGACGGAALDPFEDRLAAEVARQRHGVADDALLGLVLFERRPEGAADLDERWTNAVELPEVRIGGAVIVEREADAHGAELV